MPALRPGSGGCSTGAYGAASTDAACAKVWTYLTGLAANLSSYATDPTWGIVDGPYTVAASKGGSFSTSGQVTLVPNTSYSGPQKPTVKVQELPYTTDNAEFNALVGGALDIGYLPQQDVTSTTTDATQAGPNNSRLSNFYLSPWVLFGFNYAVLKFESTGDSGNAGAIFKQRVLPSGDAERGRPADDDLEVPEGLRRADLRSGAGAAEERLRRQVRADEPVPVQPVARQEPADVTRLEGRPQRHRHVREGRLGHGTVRRRRSRRVRRPTSRFAYASGTTWQKQVAQVEQSAWNSIGIKTALVANTFPTVVSTYAPPCQSGTPCTEELGWWGGGWEYSPDFYPSGETLFSTNAGSNASNYSNAKADSPDRGRPPTPTSTCTSTRTTSRSSCPCSGSPTRTTSSARSRTTCEASLLRTRSPTSSLSTGTS